MCQEDGNFKLKKIAGNAGVDSKITGIFSGKGQIEVNLTEQQREGIENMDATNYNECLRTFLQILQMQPSMQAPTQQTNIHRTFETITGESEELKIFFFQTEEEMQKEGCISAYDNFTEQRNSCKGKMSVQELSPCRRIKVSHLGYTFKQDFLSVCEVSH